MNRINLYEFETIRRLVGEISQEDLKFVESYVSDKLACFIPLGGCCGYAVSKNHTHPSYMFLLPYDDQTAVMLSDRYLESDSGKLFCLSPGIEHHEIQSFLPPRYCAIFIEREFFEKRTGMYGRDGITFSGENITPHPSLNILLKQFMLEYSAAQPAGHELLDALALQLTHAILRSIVPPEEHNSDALRESSELNRLTEHINRRFADGLSLKSLALYSGLSVSHMSRIFKQKLGISPNEYILHVRLEKAKKMLTVGDVSVTHVAQSCGFSTSSYFSRCFKKRFSETPMQFMKRFE